MRTLRAVDLRKSLGRVARALEREGEPVFLTLRGRAVGVLISVREWQARCTSHAAQNERRRLAAEILADRHPSPMPIEVSLDEVRRS